MSAQGGQPRPALPVSPTRPGRSGGAEPKHAASRAVSAGLSAEIPKTHASCQISDARAIVREFAQLCTGGSVLTTGSQTVGRVGTTFAGAILGRLANSSQGGHTGQCPPCNFPSKDQSRSRRLSRAVRLRACLASRRRRRSCSPLRPRERTCARGRLSVLTPRWSGDDRMLVRRGISARWQKQRRRCQAPSRLLFISTRSCSSSERASQPVRQQCDEHDPPATALLGATRGHRDRVGDISHPRLGRPQRCRQPRRAATLASGDRVAEAVPRAATNGRNLDRAMVTASTASCGRSGRRGMRVERPGTLHARGAWTNDAPRGRASQRKPLAPSWARWM